jgi:hypothetical protein
MPVKPQGLRLCHDKQWSGSNPVAAQSVIVAWTPSPTGDSGNWLSVTTSVGLMLRGLLFGQCDVFLRPISTIPSQQFDWVKEVAEHSISSSWPATFWTWAP